jgi:phage antirepressor YoqD-like protein
MVTKTEHPFLYEIKTKKISDISSFEDSRLKKAGVFLPECEFSYREKLSEAGWEPRNLYVSDFIEGEQETITTNEISKIAVKRRDHVFNAAVYVMNTLYGEDCAGAKFKKDYSSNSGYEGFRLFRREIKVLCRYSSIKESDLIKKFKKPEKSPGDRIVMSKQSGKDIVNVSSQETMSSTQLAELLGKQKKHIHEKIKKMFPDKIDGRIIRPSFDSRGYVVEYHLPELESKMFVAKEDINYLEKITRFWIDRGKTPQLPNFNDPVIAARAWADQKEARQIAEKTVKEQAQKVAALDRIAMADGAMNITVAAKHLQIQPRKDLFPYLSQHSWIYRRAGSKNWTAYQEKIKQGLLKHKITTQIVDGDERIHQQILVTPKGLAKLSEAFSDA